MAEIKLTEQLLKDNIQVGISNISKEIIDRIVIESAEVDKYVRKQIAISRWKSKVKK